MHGDDGLADFLQLALVGHLRRVFHHHHFAARHDHFVDHAGRGGDEVLVELALQAFLHDLHVQKAQKTAAKAKAQRLAYLGLVVQRGIVEFELFQCIAQLIVFARFRRIQAGKHLRLDFLETGQRLGGGTRVVRKLFLQCDGVTHLGSLQFLDPRNDETYLSGLKTVTRLRRWREDPQVVGVVDSGAGHHLETLALEEAPVDHAHQHHHTDVRIEPAVDDHGAQRAVRVAARRRHLGDDGFENFINAHASLGRAGNRMLGVNADHVLDFGLGVLRVGLWQVHLVEDRQHFHTQVKRGVAVGHGLRFDTLRGINHQQRTFAGRERTAHLVGKIDVAGRVDQVEVVNLPILRLVLQCSRLRLDGDAALLFDIHRIEHLRLHLPVGQAAAALDQPVGQRGFAVINMGNDRKISDVVHRQEGWGGAGAAQQT